MPVSAVVSKNQKDPCVPVNEGMTAGLRSAGGHWCSPLRGLTLPSGYRSTENRPEDTNRQAKPRPADTEGCSRAHLSEKPGRLVGWLLAAEISQHAGRGCRVCAMTAEEVAGISCVTGRSDCVSCPGWTLSEMVLCPLLADMSKRPLCRHFMMKGSCRYENNCAFYHPGVNGPPLPPNHPANKQHSQHGL